MDLTGKVAIVTGNGLGLGLGYATELARVWPQKFAAAQQRVGQDFPEPPK